MCLQHLLLLLRLAPVSVGVSVETQTNTEDESFIHDTGSLYTNVGVTEQRKLFPAPFQPSSKSWRMLYAFEHDYRRGIVFACFRCLFLTSTNCCKKVTLSFCSR